MIEFGNGAGGGGSGGGGMLAGCCVDLNQQVLKAFNVSGVTKLSAGVYQITFAKPLADINYIVSGSGHYDTSPNADDPHLAISRNSNLPAYGKTVNYCVVSFQDGAQNYSDCFFDIAILGFPS